MICDGRRTTPLLADTFEPRELEAWIGQARCFGFHATLSDALDYAPEDVQEIYLRLAWLASRIAPFTLVNGYIARAYAPGSLTLTFDEPSGRLRQLHAFVVTLINVLYCSSPFYQLDRDGLPADERDCLICYGASRYRIWDFRLHCSLATNIPDQPTWERLHAALLERTGLFSQPDQRVLRVEHIHLLEQQADGYFRLVGGFGLGCGGG
ncbi:MAG: hypothetical protein HC893_15675 [Chloroflexaceae bacterium]|nr:hypothetical protein [Chloroflexaceae bacterium]